MSEFGSAGAPTDPPTTPASPSKRDRFEWGRRPLVLGLSLPWIVGFALIIVLAGWFLFAPEGPPTVNQLAFGDSDMLPVTNEPRAPAAFEDEGPDIAKLKTDMATIVGGMRTFAEANRAAIERLAPTVKSTIAQQAAMQQTLTELQAQMSLLSGRLSQLEAKPVAQRKRAAPSAVPATSPLAGMHVSQAQIGMAWVLWQEKTWAVQVGDRIGEEVMVTGIDPTLRLVHTNLGTIK